MTSPQASVDESAGLKHARCDTPDITGECGILANSPIRVPSMSRVDQRALLGVFSAAEAEKFLEVKNILVMALTQKKITLCSTRMALRTMILKTKTKARLVLSSKFHSSPKA